jgi:hypothetical protein
MRPTRISSGRNTLDAGLYGFAHLLIDNSLTFDGYHWNYPRQVYAALHYRFPY